MEHRRLTLFAGHYGSGKTNIAINYALYLKKMGLPVTVADMDIVNPYFRTKDSEEMLKACGIELISSKYAGSNVELPAMPKEIAALISSKDSYGVLDIGGDDRGALAIGRYAPAILEAGDYEMLLVINRARPLTRTAQDVFNVMKEMESASGLHFTAIVNNTNLGFDTDEDTVMGNLDYALEVSHMTQLPIKMNCAEESLCTRLEGKVDNLFPLKIQKLYYMFNKFYQEV